MSKPKPLKPVLLAVSFKQFYLLKGIAEFTFKRIVMLKGNLRFTLKHSNSLKGILLAVSLSLVFGLSYLITWSPSTAYAATTNTINFQARLENASGSIVPDGTYNVEFKLYNALSSSGSSQGSCTGDAACLWHEDYLVSGSTGVSVSNGYLTVNLGSQTAFPSTIPWGQPLYLGINIGGTGSSPTWDGEMTPRLTLTAVPAAFSLESAAGSFTSTLTFVQPTASESILLPAESGSTETVCYRSDTACGFESTTGTDFIQNQNASPQTANFDITGTGEAATLEAGTFDTVSAGTLNIGKTSGGNATAISLNQNTTVASGDSLTVTAGATTLTGSSGGSSTALSVKTGAASNSGVTIGAASSQTATLLAFQDTNGINLSKFDANGNYTGTGTLTTIGALREPTGLSATPQGSGSMTGTYYYTVTATNAQGETLNPTAVSASPSSSANVLVSWTQVTGATGYKIYRNTTNTFTSGSLLLTTITNGGTTSFTDSNGSTGAGLPPTSESENYFLFTNYTNSNAVTINGYGNFGANDGLTANGLTGSGATQASLVVLQSSGSRGEIIKGQGAANALEVQDENGDDQAGFSSSGQFTSNGTNNTFGNLAVPTMSAPSLVAGGSLTVSQIYYYVITATNAQGETIASTSVNDTPTSGNQTIKLTWTQIPGATGYKVYRNTSNSFTSGSLLLTTITSGATVTYSDTGSATSAGLPPTTPTGTGVTIQGWASQTANLLQLQNSTGTVVGSFNSSGNLLLNQSIDTETNTGLAIGNSNATGITLGNSGLNNLTTIVGSGLVESASGLNSTNAFRVENASGYSELTVDTVHNQTILGNVTSTSGDQIAGVLGFADGSTDNESALLELSGSLGGTSTVFLLPVGSNTTQTICTSATASCSSYYQVAGSYLLQAPTANSGAGSNDIQPATTGINGLTVNGTNTGSSATALVVNQAKGSDGEDINATAGGVTAGLAINQSGAGTLNYGISFSGTDTDDIYRGSGTMTIFGVGGTVVDTAANQNIQLNPGTNGNVLLGSSTTGAPELEFNAPIGAGSIGTIAASGSASTFNITGQTAGTGNGGGVQISAGAAATGSVGGLLSLLGGNTSSAGTNGGVSIDTGSGASTVNGSITIGTTNAQTISLGNGNSTSLTLGQSTVSSTINIGNAATTNTQTIKIGNGSTGAGLDTVTVGSTNGSSTTTIDGGTGGTAIALTTGTNGSIAETANGTGSIDLYTSSSTSGVLDKSLTNSATAFRIQNASGVSLLTGDTANSILDIGGTLAPTYVTEADNESSNLATLSITTHNLGDLIVLAFKINANNRVVSVTGGEVSHWYMVTYNNGINHEEIWEGTVTTVGTATATATYLDTPGINCELAYEEFSSTYGASAGWFVTAANDISNTASMTITYPSLTATETGGVYFGYGVSGGTGSNGSTSGFTYHTTSVGTNVLTYDASLTQGTTYSPTAGNTTSVASDAVAMIAIPYLATGGLNMVGTTQLNGTITSPATFAASSNQQDAFQVQNASGTVVFDVDTQDNLITSDDTLQVGPGSNGTANPKFLYLADVTSTPSGNPLILGQWDNANNWGIGPNSDSTTDNALRIGTTSGNGVNTWTSTNQNINLVVAGTENVQTLTNSATALQVQNASGTDLVDVDTAGSNVNLGIGVGPAGIGYTTVGGTPDTGYASTLVGDRFTATYTGSISSISVYVGAGGLDGTHNQYQVGVYTDTTCSGNPCPGSYIASSAVSTLNGSVGWNTAAISASLTSGTKYWLVYWTNTTVSGDNDESYNAVAGGYLDTSTTITFGSGADNGMPATYTPAGAPITGYSHSIYASYAVGGYAVNINENGTLSAYDAATFSDAVNSTTAFQVQNASGSDLVDVDTTNGYVNLTGDVSSTSTETTNTAQSFVDNSITTGKGLSLSANALTTGYGANFTTTSNTQTAGSLLNLSDTASLTSNGGSYSGQLLNVSRSLTANVGTMGEAISHAGGPTNTSSTSTSQTRTESVTTSNSGDLVFMTVLVNSATITVSSITNGSNTGTWTRLNTAFDSTHNDDLEIWYATATAASTQTATVHLSAAPPSIYVETTADSFHAAGSPTWNIINSAHFYYVGDASDGVVYPTLSTTAANQEYWGESDPQDTYVNNTNALTGFASKIGGSTGLTGTTYNTSSLSSGTNYTPTGAQNTANAYSNNWGVIFEADVSGGGSANVLGAAANISSNCTNSSGTCNDSSNVLKVSQQYSGATGSALLVQNSGSGYGLQVVNGTSSTLFTVGSTGDVTSTSSETTGTAQSLTDNSVSSGYGLNLSANALTTGNGANLSTTSNVQTAGSLLNLSDTATLATSGGNVSASLFNVSRNLTSNVTGAGGTLTPTADHGATFDTYPAATSQTDSFTVNSGYSNYYMVIGVFDDIGNPAPTVTYAGATATLLKSGGIGAGTVGVYLYGLVAPATGANNLVVNGGSNSGEWAVAVEDFYNVNQTTPEANATSAKGSAAMTAQTVTTVSSDVVTDFLAETTPSVTAGSGQTAIDTSPSYTMTYGPGTVDQSTKPAVGTSTTMVWNSPTYWGWEAIDLKGATATNTEIVSGAVASISNNCTQTAGACADSTNVLSLNQQYSGATGAVLNVRNSGTGLGLNVQNGGGTSILSVDTTTDGGADNGQVIIGTGSAGETTPVLLVLDSSLSSSDPTGTNGSMYYNASTGNFRCYQAGSWQNCVMSGDGLTTMGFASDDFLNATTNAGNGSPWTCAAIAAGTFPAGAVSDRSVDVATSSTTANSGFECGTGTTQVLSTGMTYEADLDILTTTNTTTRIGFMSTFTAAITSNGCFFSITTTMTDTCDNGGSLSSGGLSYAFSTATWYRLKVQANSSSSVSFYVYSSTGALLASDTFSPTHMPTGDIGSGFTSVDSGTTATAMVDYDEISTWYNGSFR